MFDGLIARTPIYTRSLDIFGYELRLCSGAALHGGLSDDEPRWIDSLLQASREVRLEEITGANHALLCPPPAFLPRCAEISWPREKIVLAVPEPAMRDRVVEEATSHLAEAGYTIALHNPSRDLTELRRDADFVSICALDADAATVSKVHLASGTSPRWPRFLVRELETAEQNDYFRKLGFDYFEGAFFTRPRLIQGSEMPADRLAVLQLLQRLQDPNVEIDEVEDLVSRDLSLSYKLLRLLNAAYFGIPKRVESIRRAVMFFGLERIKNWASVVLVNAVDFHPRELLTTAMVRAHTCQLLAQDLGRGPTESYYLTGLFSLLDAIMDVPMAEIVEKLSLAAPLRRALLEGAGPVGEVLRTVLMFEQCEVEGAPCRNFSHVGVPTRAYLDAIRWACAVTREIQTAPV